jgi:hypothetical protein
VRVGAEGFHSTASNALGLRFPAANMARPAQRIFWSRAVHVRRWPFRMWSNTIRKKVRVAVYAEV